MANSINTNIAAYYAQTNIGISSNNVSSSVARLSSGNRIVRAADDVAALAAGTSLRTNVGTLKTALTNASQASSLLQVADGALSQITEILQRQKAIAVQAGSGSLDSNARAYLDQEFQNLSQEIDRLASNTNFNGVQLLNGALSQLAKVSATDTQATKASATLNFSANPDNGEKVIINGITLTATTGTVSTSAPEFKIGNDTAATVAALASKLNNAQTDDSFTSAQKLAIGQAQYVANNTSLQIVSFTGGTLGSKFTINTSAFATAVDSAAEANIGAQYGGTYINMFASGFSTSNAVVSVATTAAAETPFVVGETITATIGSGSTLALHTVAANDTLQTIVNGINANTTTTGITAALTYDVASSKYNIRLSTADTRGAIAISGGAGYFNTTSSGGASGVTHALNSSYGVTNLFAAGTMSTVTATVVGASSAAVPFTNGQTLQAFVNGSGTTLVLATLTTGDTLQGLADKINASTDAKANGIFATAVSDGTNGNIQLTFRDPTAAKNVSFTGGAGYYNVGTSTSTNSLNNSYSRQMMFSSGFVNSSTVVATVTASAGSPFTVGETVAIYVTGGSTIAFAISATSLTLAQLAATINVAATGTGIHASLVTDAYGKSNIQLTYANSAGSVVSGNQINITGGANYFAGGPQLSAAAETTYSTFSNLQLLAQGVDSNSTQVTAGTSTAAIPFQTNDTIAVTINGATLIAFALTTADMTLSQLAATINVAGASAGITANLITDAYGKQNIQLTYATTVLNDQNNASNTISVTAGSNFNTTTYALNSSSATTTSTTNARYVDIANSTAGAGAHLNIFGLSGGADDGLGLGGTVATGTIGDSILTGLSQNKPKVTITFPDVSADDLTTTSSFGNGTYITVGSRKFAFTTTAAAYKAADEITIGDTLAETLDNAVATINSYVGVGSDNYVLDQLRVKRDGNTLVFEGKTLSTVTTTSGSTAQATITNYTGVSASNSGNLTATTGGVIATTVSNKDFVGSIDGFKATYSSTLNQVDLSIKVGDYTYSAKNVGTNPTSNTTVRLYSDTVEGSNGGFFDIVLQGNEGISVNSQTGADTIAQRLNAAFKTLTFYQVRSTSSYSGGNSVISTPADGIIGSLVGSKVSIQSDSFDALKVEKVQVTGPVGSNANGQIAITINGERYVTSPTLGSSLGSYQTYRLTNDVDGNKYIDFTTGASTVDFSNDAKALAFQNALKLAFGVNADSAALKFQVGTNSTDTLSVSIDDVTTDTLYGGVTLDVLTQDSAGAAATIIDSAINSITKVRATVGALQSRFNFASTNIQSSIQNQDAARGVLLDTDVASESTSYATEQVKLQAGISVLAQANQQLQSLLKLIG